MRGQFLQEFAEHQCAAIRPVMQPLDDVQSFARNQPCAGGCATSKSRSRYIKCAFIDTNYTNEHGIFQSRGGENLVDDDDAIRRGLFEDVVNPDQVVLQFAAKCRDVFLPLKMREETVEKKQLGFRAWH